MILLCGATGLLGGKIAERLAARAVPFRVLVRPSADTAALAKLGAEIARGDLRDASSLPEAVADVGTVITTVTAIGRMLGGEKSSLDEVDRGGTINLVDAAERANVERFVYVSAGEIERDPRMPLASAKLAVEDRLRRSPLRAVIIRPQPFAEVWISPGAQLDWDAGKLRILGTGAGRVAYVAVDDVAEAVVRLALAPEAPESVEFGGPERLTRGEVADLIEEAAGRMMQRRNLPTAIVRAGRVALRPVKPELASLFALALLMEDDSRTDDTSLRELGIDAKPASQYIRETVRR